MASGSSGASKLIRKMKIDSRRNQGIPIDTKEETKFPPHKVGEKKSDGEGMRRKNRYSRSSAAQEEKQKRREVCGWDGGEGELLASVPRGVREAPQRHHPTARFTEKRTTFLRGKKGNQKGGRGKNARLL